jgi:hypothetical protein
LNEKVKVIRRMEHWQSHPTVCRDLNIIPSTVTAIMNDAGKIKKTVETARRKTATTLRYTCGTVIRKMEQLLSL